LQVLSILMALGLVLFGEGLLMVDSITTLLCPYMYQVCLFFGVSALALAAKIYGWVFRVIITFWDRT